MSERDDLLSQPHTFSPPLSTILISLKIFLRNKQLFLSLFALTTLPLSFLLVSLSLFSLPFKSHVLHLEAVAFLSSTRFEASHVWKESRVHALSLLKIKALFFLPSYFLSLLAAVTAVKSTASSCHATRPTLRTAFAGVKLTWKRPFVTTIFIYALSLLYAPVPLVLAPLTGSPASEFLVLVIGSGFEIYLMAVLSLGLVVSIVEERFGWDAIRVGSGVMAGRRFSGWALSGLFVFISGAIARDLQRMMDSLDSSSEPTTSTAMRVATVVKDNVGLIFLYGIVVLWSYIVTTVFYCECRKRHVGRGEDESVTV
jgi:hypothetical protein